MSEDYLIQQIKSNNLMDMLFQDANTTDYDSFTFDDLAEDFLPPTVKKQQQEEKSYAINNEIDKTDVIQNMIIEEIKNIINPNTDETTREKAIEWVFVPNQDNEDGVTFNLCCEANQIRPALLQLRTQYECFLKNIIFQNPLPFMAIGIPDYFELKIFGYFLNEDAQIVANAIWAMPGIRADILIRSLPNIDKDFIISCTKKLEEEGILSLNTGHWFFTGINPLRRGFESNVKAWTRLPL